MPPVAWLASYPRSGNTWTRVMLASYLVDAQLDSLDTLRETVPEFHLLLVMGKIVPFDEPRPSIVKTHFLPDAELMQLYKTLTRKVVYLVRNPRDVILSAGPHLGIRPERRPEFAKDFIQNRGAPIWIKQWGTWLSSVQKWADQEQLLQYFPNTKLLVVRYEDMREDPRGKLQEILGFLDLDGDLDRVRRAVDNSTLERMRAAEEEVRAQLSRYAKPDVNADRFIGRGLQNQSLAVLGEDVETAYQAMLRKDEEFFTCLKKFGYEE